MKVQLWEVIAQFLLNVECIILKLKLLVKEEMGKLFHIIYFAVNLNNNIDDEFIFPSYFSYIGIGICEQTVKLNKLPGFNSLYYSF